MNINILKPSNVPSWYGDACMCFSYCVFTFCWSVCCRFFKRTHCIGKETSLSLSSSSSSSSLNSRSSSPNVNVRICLREGNINRPDRDSRTIMLLWSTCSLCLTVLVLMKYLSLLQFAKFREESLPFTRQFSVYTKFAVCWFRIGYKVHMYSVVERTQLNPFVGLLLPCI